MYHESIIKNIFTKNATFNTNTQHTNIQHPRAAKLALSGQPDAISQPTGTHPIPRLISTSKDGKVESNTAGEKLHQKKHWRDHRMLLDLKPLVEEGSELDKVGSSIIFFDQVVGHYWPVC